MKTKTSVFQSAQDNWPEDEAAGIAQAFRNMCEDYPDEMADNIRRFAADCERMESRYFRPEPDGAELCKRFRRQLCLSINLDGIPGLRNEPFLQS